MVYSFLIIQLGPPKWWATMHFERNPIKRNPINDDCIGPITVHDQTKMLHFLLSDAKHHNQIILWTETLQS